MSVLLEQGSPWLRPEWPAPAGIGALMTTRHGGVSRAPYDSMNLGDHVGDAVDAVRVNRSQLIAATGAEPVFLRQVHGTKVVHLRPGDAQRREPIEADAAVANEPALACTVMVADCLPVLFAAANGRAVGAAHAGWRGLAAGVLEATLADVRRLADCRPADVVTWLGPCIGPSNFEVGDDVRQAFIEGDAQAHARFKPGVQPGKWWADLPALARDRLLAAGVTQVAGGAWCTVDDRSRFFSFRRDGVTGRMAATVWIAAGGGR